MTLHTFTSLLRQTSFSVVLGTAFGFLFAGYMVLAQFSEPPADPPTGNTKPPLDQSDKEQIKDAALIVNGDLPPPADTGLRVYGYTQVDLTSLLGQPPSSDCNNVSEWGRTVLNYTSNRLYICDPGGAGWGFSL